MRVQEPWVSGYRPWTVVIETVVLEEALRVARDRLLAGFNVSIYQKEDKG